MGNRIKPRAAAAVHFGARMPRPARAVARAVTFSKPRPALYSEPFHHVEIRLEPIEGLSEDERELLGDALRTPRAERGRAWNATCDAAEAAGRHRPSLRPYGIDDIKRLARRLGAGPTHWSESR
jgi:hypothetical protein